MMSNFSFSHSVFKILALETLRNQGLFGKGLSQKRSIIPKKKNAFLIVSLDSIDCFGH